jgi:hypothetical protein
MSRRSISRVAPMVLAGFLVQGVFAQDAAMTDFADRLVKQLAARKATRLAVLRFANNQGYDARFSRYLVDFLNRRFAVGGRNFEVIGRGEVEESFDSAGNQARDLSSDVLKSAAKKLVADALINGNYTVTGNRITIEAEVLDPKTTNLIGGQEVTVDRAPFDGYLSKEQLTTVAPPASPPAAVGATPVQVAPVAGSPDEQKRIALKAQSIVTVSLRVLISSRGVKPGQEFDALVTENVVAFGNVVVSSGAKAKVVVQNAAPDRVSIALSSVEMVDGEVRHPVTNSIQKVSQPPASGLGSLVKGGKLSLGSILNAGNQTQQNTPPAEIPPNVPMQFALTSDLPWR